MPIWSVMCCQLWEEPSFFRLETSWVLMLMMRSAMPFTSCNHCFRKSGEVRMVAVIRAPLRGGLEYRGRIKIFSCDSTLLASSASLQTTVKAPTRSPYRPMFLAYDWQRQTLMPCSMKCRTAQASLSPSPLAKPW
uniref:Uncharacterized protein n=1 Tax=Mus musculus TaxID=10090 RepID=Q3V0I1_MOUSE|nr:unnamed protein product [Mus musculus]